jgi:tetratricopeptide (TPR) repeat protein
VKRRIFVSAAIALLLASAALFARQASAPGESKSGNPDELYRRREDLASATRAASLWSAAAATDFEAAWKLARAGYWLGTHLPEAERRAALERGVSAGEAAVGLRPDRPEGHFWLAANMGVLAESYGLSQGLKYRSRIKSELEKSMAIDPLWSQASAETALGQWYMKVPRLFGGSRAKAEERFRRVLERFPQSKNALLFLAEGMIVQGRPADARRLLERLIETPIEPDWAPEDRDLKRKAAARLESLK